MTPEELRDRIDTFVIVMMENRSFDHVLGHLSLPQFGNRQDVHGLPSLDNPDFANARTNGLAVLPFLAPDDHPLPNDIPHERPFVTQQIAFAPAAGAYVMNGFVQAYEAYTGTSGLAYPPCMRILTPTQIPITSFFANQFMVCDHWHAPLPTSTQPNRLMAMSGFTVNDTTINGLLPGQDTMLEWLDALGITWRIYSAGLPFLTLMRRLWPRMLTDNFKSLAWLAYDFQHESAATFPQVIIVEPDYDDSPIHLSGHASDNHPPVPVSFGEIFLKTVYEAVTSGDRWAKTLMVQTYDEHGGFFDHIAPPPIPCPPPPGASYTEAFTSTGVRVPALLISPYAPRHSVSHTLLDHTSILQMLADRFDKTGTPYSADVQARLAANPPIASVTSVLSPTARTDVPDAPASPISVIASLETIRQVHTPGQLSFAAAIQGFAAQQGQDGLKKYPDIAHWLASK